MKNRSRRGPSRSRLQFGQLEPRQLLATFFVAENGNDSWPGTIDQPFETIDRATDFVQQGDTVFVREGVYREEVTLTGSGNPVAPITFRAFPGEHVVVSGGELLADWVQVDGNIWSTTVSGNAGNNQANNTLFVNGQLKLAARQFADSDPLNIANWGVLKQGRLQNNATSFVVDDLAGFANDVWNGAKIRFHVNDYTLIDRTITDFNSNTGRITLDSSVGLVSQKQDNGYYIYDTIEALDQPGEWFKELGSNTIYYYAENGQNPNDLEIEFKQRAFGFDLRSRQHIHVQDFEFRGVSLELNSASDNNLVIGNRFIGFDKGNFGRFFVSGDNNVLRNNEFQQTWNSVLTFGGVGNQFVNNHVHDIGYLGTARVLVASGAQEMLISHNTINSFSRSFLDGYPSRSEISYNVFENGGTLTWDTGVFDADGGNGDSSYSIFHHNVFRGTSTRGIFEAFYGRNNNAVVHHNLIYDFNSNSNRTVFRASGLEFRQSYHNTIISSYDGRPSGNLEARDSVGTRYNNNLQISLDRMEALGVDVRGNHNYSAADFVDFSGEDFRLATGSPAIDTGVLIQGINDNYQGNAPDSGAFEFGEPAWEAGHDFVDPPNPVYAWTPLPGTNLFENGQFLQGIGDWTIVAGTPNSADRNSWNLSASGASLTGTFRTQSVEFTPGESIQRTFDGLQANSTYTLGVEARIVNRIGDAGDFDAANGTITSGSHRDEEFVTGLASGEWVRYDNVDFGDPEQFNQLDLLHIRDPNNISAPINGVSVQVRLDAANGPLIANFTELKDGTTVDRWRADRTPISNVSGIHSIYVSVIGANSANLALGSFRLLNDALPTEDLLTLEVEAASSGKFIPIGSPDWRLGYEKIEFSTGEDETSAVVRFTNDGRMNAYLDRMFLIEGSSTRGGQPGNVSALGVAERLVAPGDVQPAPGLNDGDVETVAISGNVANSWLQLDLGEAQGVYGIELVPVQSFTNLLSNFRVSVWDDNPDVGGNLLWSQTYLTGFQDQLSNHQNLMLPSSAIGEDGETRLGDVQLRYVRVQSIGLNAASTFQVAMSELNILGFDETNVALTDGFATQSTTSAPAENAIDGVDATVSETSESDQDSWWQVRFPQAFSVGQIEIENRDDSLFKELGNFTVSVWDEDPTRGGVQIWKKAFYSSGHLGQGDVLVIDGGEVSDDSTRRLASMHTARVIRIQLNGLNNEGNGRLGLANVRVATSGDEVSPFNLVATSIATQSSELYGSSGVAGAGGAAIEAIDGAIFPRSNFISTKNEQDAWWQADLQQSTEIDQIVLYNRTDAAERLDNFRVSVWETDPNNGGSPLWMRDYDYSSNSATFSTGNTIGPGGALIIDGSDDGGTDRLDQLTNARFVRVELLGANFLHLAEVQVWGPGQFISVDTSQTRFEYDLGTTDSPLDGSSNYTLLSEHLLGDVQWSGQLEEYDLGSGSGFNLLNRDGIRSSSTATLEHRVGNGRWDVTITFGDQLPVDQVGVVAEGEFQGLESFAAGQHGNYSFSINVLDGGLTLDFVDLGGVNSDWSVTRIVMESDFEAPTFVHGCEQTFRYDVGPADSGLFNDPENPYSRLTANVNGDISWSAPVEQYDLGMGSGENLLNRDGVRKSDGSSILEHKIGFGLWEVLVTFGDVTAIDQVGVIAEGVFQGAADYAAGQHANYIFQTMVFDGGLTLEFADLGGSNSNWSITRLILTRLPGPALRDCNTSSSLSSILDQPVAINGTTTFFNPDNLNVRRSSPVKRDVGPLRPTFTESDELLWSEEFESAIDERYVPTSSIGHRNLHELPGQNRDDQIRILDEVFEEFHFLP